MKYARVVSGFSKSTTTHLAATYLTIIMLMSIGFSVVFYNASSHELDRQIAPNSLRQQTGNISDDSPFTIQTTNDKLTNANVHSFLQQRAREGRSELFIKLLIVNGAALVAGSVISFFLARRTLQPIEQAMAAQSQFVSDASHELRTPLTAIRASNDVALRNPKLSLSAAKQVIRENTEEAIKLKQLSDSLLDLAKQDTQHPKLISVSIQDALTEATNHVLSAAQVKDITIDDALPNLQVQNNAQALSQVLVILLDNAIKYGKIGGHVSVSATQKSRHVYLSITDDGMGIRASDLPHIFRRFYRADTARSDSQRNGYGLGLAIADNLMRSHGASISARSELGKGSTFTIKLPLV